MRDSPVAVRVGDKLRAPLRLELDFFIGVLSHIGEHAVGVIVHRLRRKCEGSCQDADFFLERGVDIVLFACRDLVILELRRGWSLVDR
eukprot:3189229-Pleurochrysis_carterae.AAC.1